MLRGVEDACPYTRDRNRCFVLLRYKKDFIKTVAKFSLKTNKIYFNYFFIKNIDIRLFL